MRALPGMFLAFLLLTACKGPEPVRYQTTAVDRGDIVARVTASGTLSALVTVQVGSQVSGRVQELHADFNTQVRKGDVVARIDPGLFETALEQAQANLSAAQSRHRAAMARAAEAQRQRDRAQNLAQRQLLAMAQAETAQAELDIANGEVDAAQGAIAQSRAALRQAQVNLDYTTIISPIDGVVLSRNVDVGQTVAASFQAPVLFTIAEDLARMQVEASVSEADIGRLSAGGDASFSVDAWPDQTFQGTIRQIRNAAQVLQNVVTYTVVIDVENPELRLRPGMTANVTFEVDRRDQALRVQNTALHYKPPDAPRRAGGRAAEGTRTLWVLQDEKPAAVTIQPGLSDGVHTEVVGGDLAEGALVITDSSGGKGSKGSPFMPSSTRGSKRR